MLRKLAVAVLVLLATSCNEPLAPTSWTVNSPDGKLQLTVRSVVTDTTEGQLEYLVKRQGEQSAADLVLPSPLGIVRDDTAFKSGLKFVGSSASRLVEDTYPLVHGKKLRVRSLSNEMVVRFANGEGKPLELVLRAFDDGVAFRYRFPEQNSDIRTIRDESTGFRIPDGSLLYSQPYQEAGQYTPAYESFYEKDIPVGTTSSSPLGWSFPALFRLPGEAGWVLITESGMDGTYCGSHLSAEAPENLYSLRFPNSAEGQGVGEVSPRNSLPWSTPWRVMMATPALSGIFASTMVTDLAEPAKLPHPAWIKPGRVSWSWWSDGDSPSQYEKQLQFVDLASEMGWEYALVDAGWDKMAPEAIPNLVRYAASKNVGILLWYNSGGPHNIVNQYTPRERMFDREVRRKEMQWLRETGVKGVKVDFFQSDKQNMFQFYRDILEDAAEFQLMVNFHGCTIPRGWERTYPHMMSMESVRGAESYIFDPSYPENAPWHNTVLPYTRNAVGPMDYTPVTLSNSRFPHRTTLAHEIALSVVYQSGWVHLADSVESYRSLAEGPKGFLKRLPVTWDESIHLAGEPGKFAVIARRSGTRWIVGGISGEGEPRSVDISLNQLATLQGKALLITDPSQGSGLRCEEVQLTPDGHLILPMKPWGGFVLESLAGE